MCSGAVPSFFLHVTLTYLLTYLLFWQTTWTGQQLPRSVQRLVVSWLKPHELLLCTGVCKHVCAHLEQPTNVSSLYITQDLFFSVVHKHLFLLSRHFRDPVQHVSAVEKRMRSLRRFTTHRDAATLPPPLWLQLFLKGENEDATLKAKNLWMAFVGGLVPQRPFPAMYTLGNQAFFNVLLAAIAHGTPLAQIDTFLSPKLLHLRALLDPAWHVPSSRPGRTQEVRKLLLSVPTVYREGATHDDTGLLLSPDLRRQNTAWWARLSVLLARPVYVHLAHPDQQELLLGAVRLHAMVRAYHYNRRMRTNTPQSTRFILFLAEHAVLRVTPHAVELVRSERPRWGIRTTHGLPLVGLEDGVLMFRIGPSAARQTTEMADGELAFVQFLSILRAHDLTALGAVLRTISLANNFNVFKPTPTQIEGGLSLVQRRDLQRHPGLLYV